MFGILNIGLTKKTTLYVFIQINPEFVLFIRVPLDKMAALDLLVMLELEVSLESWDSLDQREPL